MLLRVHMQLGQASSSRQPQDFGCLVLPDLVDHPSYTHVHQLAQAL